MNAVRLIVVGWLCLGAAVVDWAANENLIVNGGFSPSTGWSIGQVGGVTATVGGNGIWYPNPAPDGDGCALILQGVDMERYGWATTTVAVPDGEDGVYRLSLQGCRRDINKGFIPSLRILIDDEEVALQPLPSLAWTQLSFLTPKLTEGAHVLKFVVVAPQKDVAAVVDMVSIAFEYPTENLLLVSETPVPLAPVTPAVGVHTRQAESVPCSVTAADFTDPSGRTNATFRSWDVYSLDLTKASPRQGVDKSGATTSVTVNLDGDAKELVWNFDFRYKVTAAVADPSEGAVAVAEQWVDAGARCTIEAVPSEGHSFLKWTGDLPADAEVGSSRMTFVAERAHSATATFRSAYYVAPTGAEGASDANAGTTKAAPFATIAAALAAAAQDSGNVVLLKGRHEVPTALSVSTGTTVEGETGDWRDVVLDGLGNGIVGVTLNQSSAILRHVTVSNFFSRGVAVQSGRLESCRVTACKCARGANAAGVYNANGTVVDCLIDGNTCAGNMYGGIGYMQDGAKALASRCVITNNCYAQGHGQYSIAGAYVTEGRMEDCLIAFNGIGTFTESQDNASCATGIKVTGGTVANCAIVGNFCREKTPPGGKFYAGLYHAGGTVVNCVVQDNVDSVGAPNDVAGKATVSPTDVDWAITSAGFKLAPGTDAAIGPRSAHEYDGFYADIAVSARTARPGEAVTFTAAANRTDLTCAWRFVNEIDDAVQTATGVSVEKALPAGLWRVELTATCGTDVLSRVYRHRINVFPDVVYVDSKNAAGAVYPYTTPQTAAARLEDVIRQQHDGLTVRVVAGSSFALERQIALFTGTCLVGDGSPADTSVSAQNQDRVLYVGHPDARVSNLTLCDGRDPAGVNVYGDVSYCLGGGAIAWLNGGGTVSNCVLTRGQTAASGRSIPALGAFIWGGTVTHSDIHTFTVGKGFDASRGIAVRVKGGGLLSHSVVSNAVANGYKDLHSDQPGTAAVRIDDGEVRNCLIVDNHIGHTSAASGKKYAGGVYMDNKSARLVSSTIVGNTINLGGVNAVGGVAVGVGGTVVNCIVSGNLNATGEANVTGGGTWSHTAVPEYAALTPESGNMDIPAVLFADGGWTLPVGSALIGKGAVETWMVGAKDLAGADRIHDDDLVEPGAFAYVRPPLGCVIKTPADVVLGLDRLDTVLSVEADGNTEGLSCVWSDESGKTLGTDLTLPVSLTAVGLYRFTVDISNSAGASATATIELRVAPSVVYVKPQNDGAAYPYDSWETAATNVFEALAAAADGSTLLFDDGSYPVERTVAVSKLVHMKTKHGPSKTVLWSEGKFTTVAYSAAGCVFSGFTVSNGYVKAVDYSANGVGGGNLFLSNGAIADNCVFWGGSGEKLTGGVGVGVLDATLRNSTITGLKTAIGDSTSVYYGLGLCMGGPDCVVTNCRIVGNCYTDVHHDFAAGVSCGVTISDGLLTHCLVADNRMLQDRGSSTSAVCGVFVLGGRVENCTVVSNTCTSSALNTAGLRMTGGSVKNCIVWDNVKSDGAISNVSGNSAKIGASLTYTCADPLQSGVGCIAADPEFVNPARGKWKIRRSSPCATSGENGTYMGCFKPGPGLAVLVR